MLSGLGSAAASAVEELQRLPPRERAKAAARAGGTVDDDDEEEERETRPRLRRPMEGAGEGATRGTRRRALSLDSGTSARVSMTRDVSQRLSVSQSVAERLERDRGLIRWEDRWSTYYADVSSLSHTQSIGAAISPEPGCC